MRRGRRVDTGGVRVRAMDRSREFNDIGDEYRGFTRTDLEERTLIDRSGMDHGRGVAAAKAEIMWRDREYAKEQENSRRELSRSSKQHELSGGKTDNSSRRHSQPITGRRQRRRH